MGFRAGFGVPITKVRKPTMDEWGHRIRVADRDTNLFHMWQRVKFEFKVRYKTEKFIVVTPRAKHINDLKGEDEEGD